MTAAAEWGEVGFWIHSESGSNSLLTDGPLGEKATEPLGSWGLLFPEKGRLGGAGCGQGIELGFKLAMPITYSKRRCHLMVGYRWEEGERA